MALSGAAADSAAALPGQDFVWAAGVRLVSWRSWDLRAQRGGSSFSPCALAVEEGAGRREDSGLRSLLSLAAFASLALLMTLQEMMSSRIPDASFWASLYRLPDCPPLMVHT